MFTFEAAGIAAERSAVGEQGIVNAIKGAVAVVAPTEGGGAAHELTMPDVALGIVEEVQRESSESEADVTVAVGVGVGTEDAGGNVGSAVEIRGRSS